MPQDKYELIDRKTLLDIAHEAGGFNHGEVGTLEQALEDYKLASLPDVPDVEELSAFVAGWTEAMGR